MDNSMINCIDKMLKSPQYKNIGSNRFKSKSRKPLTPALKKLSDVSQGLADANKALGIILNTFSIERGFIGRTISVGTSPVKIVDGQYPRYYKALNSSSVVGITSSGTILPLNPYTGLNNTTQGSSLGVASHKSIGLFLNVTVDGGGIITINTQSKDPVSGNWVDTQVDIFGASSAVGTYFADIGNFGVNSDFAIDYSVSAGTSNFSVGYVLKEGLGGSGTGTARTIYLGTNEGLTITNGFPLLEGADFSFYAKTNTEVFAISEIPTGIDLKIFELQ